MEDHGAFVDLVLSGLLGQHSGSLVEFEYRTNCNTSAGDIYKEPESICNLDPCPMIPLVKLIA